MCFAGVRGDICDRGPGGDWGTGGDRQRSEGNMLEQHMLKGKIKCCHVNRDVITGHQFT